MSVPFLDPKRKRFNIDVMHAIDDRGEWEGVLSHAPRYYFLDAQFMQGLKQLAQQRAAQRALQDLYFRD